MAARQPQTLSLAGSHRNTGSVYLEFLLVDKGPVLPIVFHRPGGNLFGGITRVNSQSLCEVEASQVGRIFLDGQRGDVDGLVLFPFGREICQLAANTA